VIVVVLGRHRPDLRGATVVPEFLAHVAALVPLCSHRGRPGRNDHEDLAEMLAGIREPPHLHCLQFQTTWQSCNTPADVARKPR